MRAGRAGALFGPDIDPRTGSLLSIAQLQVALRTGAPGYRGREDEGPGGTSTAPHQVGAPAGRGGRAPVDPGLSGQAGPGVRAGGGVPSWVWRLTPAVVVVSAQPATGCSTVAMAIAEAAADRAATHLIEVADAAQSGLAAATRTELGADPAGMWRHGRRDQVLVARPEDLVPDRAPEPDRPAAATVVDLGHPRLPLRPGALSGLAGPAVVAVGRATIPGISRLEVLLAALDRPALVAVIGPSRWPRPVRAVAGPLLRQAENAGALVHVLADRDLAVTGLTPAPLPRRVADAGRRLWQLTLTAPPDSRQTTAVSTWTTRPTRTGAPQ